MGVDFQLVMINLFFKREVEKSKEKVSGADAPLKVTRILAVLVTKSKPTMR